MPLPLLGPLLVVTAVEPEAAAVRAGIAMPPAPLVVGGDTGNGDDALADNDLTALPVLRAAVPPSEPDMTGGDPARAAGDPLASSAPLGSGGPDASLTSSAPPADSDPDVSGTPPASGAVQPAGRTGDAAADDGGADEDSSTVSAGHLVDGVDTQIVVAAVGVGAAEAAAGTARLLALAEAAGRPYASVISAGIGGGLPGRAVIGDTVIAVRSIAADLGADSADGYLPIEELGFGSSVVAADEGLSALLRESLPDALIGDVLTVNTVTGTGDRAIALAARHPVAVAEAMEGYGVAVAARAAGVAFAELRTISNPVGPRDRGAWNLPAAFTALTAAFAALTSAPDQPGSD